RNLFAMDGVAGLTQAPVAPGEKFQYQFPLADAGTYWYHSHTKAWSQVARGLYGPLIVEDDSDPLVDHDLVLMIDDWRLTEAGQIDERSFGSLHDWSHGGRLGNWLTVNGRSKPTLTVGSQSRLRLRIINAANARVFGLQLPISAQLIAQDGFPCPITAVDYVEVGPAQRADLIIDIGSEAVTLVETLNGNPITAATLEPVDAIQAKVEKASLSAPQLKPAPIQVDKTIAIRMQGGAMGNLNAMHLHGHHFWIRNEAGLIEPGQRDTYLFSRGEKASLIFEADNPGLWLFHCHMFEHHAAGMGAVIEVT
ncbi:MAG: multicopper oxidase family protein, partial [Gammaproteobacteria bacterium]|nr:multicopper oxidase family protein [Gammaproteobacteria bacterium]